MRLFRHTEFVGVWNDLMNMITLCHKRSVSKMLDENRLSFDSGCGLKNNRGYASCYLALCEFIGSQRKYEDHT